MTNETTTNMTETTTAGGAATINNTNMNTEEIKMNNENNNMTTEETKMNNETKTDMGNETETTTAEATMNNEAGRVMEAEAKGESDMEQEEPMLEVFEREYYEAKERHEAGHAPVPSLLQEDTFGFGPYLKRDMIERCAGDIEIPLDELAVKENYLPEHIALLESARAAGVFQGGRGTALVPETNGVVYAGIWETEKRTRVIRVMFRRSDGGYTYPIELDNAAFTIAAQTGFNIEDKKVPFYKDIVNFHKKAVASIIDRLPLGAGIDYEVTLAMLWKYRNNLPLHELIEDEASVETIYSEILHYIAQHNRKHHEATKYFRLDSNELEEIADALNMSAKQVGAKLKEHSLLYLTPSSRGYQTKVKYKGVAENYYCVLKSFGQQSIPQYQPTVLEDGAQVVHDGTVRTPLTLYQQLFGATHPKELDTEGSDGSDGSNVNREATKVKGYTKVEW